MQTLDGKVKKALLVDYPRGPVFQDLSGNDEGMCGFNVMAYIKIEQPRPVPILS